MCGVADILKIIGILSIMLTIAGDMAFGRNVSMVELVVWKMIVLIYIARY